MCACHPITLPNRVNDPYSALEDIEKRSQALLAKAAAARFIDKGEDSKEVAGLIERLREAVTQYQVSGGRVVGRVALTWNNRYRNNKRYTPKSPTSR